MPSFSHLVIGHGSAFDVPPPPFLRHQEQQSEEVSGASRESFAMFPVCAIVWRAVSSLRACAFSCFSSLLARRLAPHLARVVLCACPFTPWRIPRRVWCTHEPARASFGVFFFFLRAGSSLSALQVGATFVLLDRL